MSIRTEHVSETNTLQVRARSELTRKDCEGWIAEIGDPVEPHPTRSPLVRIFERSAHLAARRWSEIAPMELADT